MILFQGFLFGATLAIAIGPIALFIIRYAATGGFQAGLASACGAAFADLTYAVVALSVGIVIAPLLTEYTLQAQVFASLTLVGFGLWLLWTTIRPQQIISKDAMEPTRDHRRLAPFFTTYVLTVVNPLTVIAFLAFIGQLPPETSITGRTIAAIGLFVGSLCVQVVLAMFGVLVGRVLTTGRSVQILNVVSGVGIVLFGVVGLSIL